MILRSLAPEASASASSATSATAHAKLFTMQDFKFKNNGLFLNHKS